MRCKSFQLHSGIYLVSPVIYRAFSSQRYMSFAFSRWQRRNGGKKKSEGTISAACVRTICALIARQQKKNRCSSCSADVRVLTFANLSPPRGLDSCALIYDGSRIRKCVNSSRNCPRGAGKSRVIVSLSWCINFFPFRPRWQLHRRDTVR